MKADHRVVRMGRPQLRPDEVTRKIIHEAARAEFLASGYAPASMRDHTAVT
jgi:hypothetical protein